MGCWLVSCFRLSPFGLVVSGGFPPSACALLFLVGSWFFLFPPCGLVVLVVSLFFLPSLLACFVG